MDEHTHTYTHKHTLYARTHTHTHTHTHAHIHTHTHTQAYIYTCMKTTHICTLKHTHIRTYINRHQQRVTQTPFHMQPHTPKDTHVLSRLLVGGDLAAFVRVCVSCVCVCVCVCVCLCVCACVYFVVSPPLPTFSSFICCRAVPTSQFAVKWGGFNWENMDDDINVFQPSFCLSRCNYTLLTHDNPN